MRAQSRISCDSSLAIEETTPGVGGVVDLAYRPRGGVINCDLYVSSYHFNAFILLLVQTLTVGLPCTDS